jgi:predicted enzyme related to lactoylglutathione lyase/quinol monooxygenase YgiN
VTTLDPEAGYLTLINTFTVDPSHADELLELLQIATQERMRALPGFVSANLHISDDRRRIVNYAQWRSKKDYEAMQHDIDAKTHMSEAAKIADSYDPVFCELRYVEASTATKAAPKLTGVVGPDFLALQVHDLAASERFYTDKLGLVRTDGPPDAVIFDTKPIPFALRKPMVDLHETSLLGWGVSIWLRADAIDALHQRLSDAGTPIVSRPQNGPFGRYFSFSDPDGYTVTLHGDA